MILKIAKHEIDNPTLLQWQQNLQQYSQKHNCDFKQKAFYLAKTSSFNPMPNNTSLILIRLALANFRENEPKEQKKYVILQTYYGEGDFSTIDVVKLPLNHHKEIAQTYLEEILTSDINQDYFKFKNNFTRFLTAGGFIERNDNTIKFYEASSNFSNQFSRYNVNDIAAYLTKESKLFDKVESENLIENGKEYIERCLEIMIKSKLTPEFYSKITEFYLSEPIKADKGITPQIIGSLSLIKSIDRAIKEKKDLYQTLSEEMGEGIDRELIIRGFLEKSKRIKRTNL